MNAVSMLASQKTGTERAVGHDRDFVRNAVVPQSIRHVADGEVVVVLDNAKTRSKTAKLCVSKWLFG